MTKLEFITILASANSTLHAQTLLFDKGFVIADYEALMSAYIDVAQAWDRCKDQLVISSEVDQ